MVYFSGSCVPIEQSVLFYNFTIYILQFPKNCFKAHCYVKRFSKYISLKIEILLIPLLASSHIFEISEEVHPNTMYLDTTLDFNNAFLSPDVSSRTELISTPRLTPETALRADGSEKIVIHTTSFEAIFV
jgi:hypothetical protein